MGQVYRATDTTLGRQVAVKILPDAFASDPDRMAPFEREAKTLASKLATYFPGRETAGRKSQRGPTHPTGKRSTCRQERIAPAVRRNLCGRPGMAFCLHPTARPGCQSFSLGPHY